MRCLRKFIVIAIVLSTSNCAVGPNFKRPMDPIPKTYTNASLGTKTQAVQARFGQSQHFAVNKAIPHQWWQLFHSKALNELVLASFQQNPNVVAAHAALRTAMEGVYAQKGAFYPFVGASFAPTTQQTAGTLQSNLASNEYRYALYTGQLFVSYTIDAFGGIRRQRESLIAQTEFQRFELEATYLTLSSNVVNAAIQEAALREQIGATKLIVASQRKIVSIYQQRFKLGDIAIAELATQQAALAATEATLPPLEKQLALQRDLLNALTGRFPDDPKTPSFTFQSLRLPTDLPISVPTALLEHRPDIRMAEEQMHAANALIGVAVANRLPNLTIGYTSLGTAALDLGALFSTNTGFWGLAGLIAQPIFDAGTLRHKQRAAEATYAQAAAQYRATVINAFQNVADTLKSVKIDAEALHAAVYADRAALKSLMIAKRQVALGDNNTLWYLINEQLYQQARLNLIQAQANRLSDTVALFQALGGGWWNHDCPPKRHPTAVARIDKP